MSAAYSIFASDLLVDGDIEAYIERRAATASLSYRWSDTITLQLGAGATLGGRLFARDRRYSFDAGWIASAAGTWRVLGKGRDDLFLIGGVALAASGADTRPWPDTGSASDRATMIALDIRVSAMFGKTFFDVLSPYAVARAFGGPIFWRLDGKDVAGTDKYHVQLGAGVVVALPANLDVYTEVIPLGERAAVVGLGYSF